MLKKKKVVKTKESGSAREVRQKEKCSWIWYVLGTIVLVGLLFLLYGGMTGNAIRSFSFSSIESAGYQIQPVLQFFLGGENYSGYLFERFLFFLIILSIVFVALKGAKLFEDQRKIVTLLSVVIAILSVRFINFEWLMTMVMSYAVLGVAIVSFLPFVIYFFFLEGLAQNSSAARRVGWVLYICIYLGLYFNAEDRFYGAVYLWTIGAALVLIALDESIHRAMNWRKIRGYTAASVNSAILGVRRNMVQAGEDKTRGVITQKEYDHQMTILTRNLKSLYRHLP